MDFKELLAYKKSFELAMEIFEISRAFPTEEKYALTDQIRRSSRSVFGKYCRIIQKKKICESFYK